jgi:hypothetical protein
LCSRCGENALFAQRLGQLSFELLIILGTDTLGVSVPLNKSDGSHEWTDILACIERNRNIDHTGQNQPDEASERSDQVLTPVGVATGSMILGDEAAM